MTVWITSPRDQYPLPCVKQIKWKWDLWWYSALYIIKNIIFVGKIGAIQPLTHWIRCKTLIWDRLYPNCWHVRYLVHGQNSESLLKFYKYPAARNDCTLCDLPTLRSSLISRINWSSESGIRSRPRLWWSGPQTCGRMCRWVEYSWSTGIQGRCRLTPRRTQWTEQLARRQ